MIPQNVAEANATLSALSAALSNLRDSLHTPSEALQSAVTTKLLHDELHAQVEQARTQAQNEQQSLMSLGTELASLRYERALLEREIAHLQQTPTPSLSALNSTVPTSDDEETHKRMNRELKAELAKRREMREEVDQVVVRTEEKRKELADLRKQLTSLPEAAGKLREAVKPVSLVVGGGFGIEEDEVRNVKELPAALYVLAREALGYRAMKGGIRVDVVGDGVGIWVEEGVQKVGGVFKWRDGVVVVEGENVDELWPGDDGKEKPTVEGGAAEGAYVWANLVCGVPCLPKLREGWGDGRFAEVVKRMRGRLRECAEIQEVLGGLERGIGGEGVMVERFARRDRVWGGGVEVGGVRIEVEVEVRKDFVGGGIWTLKGGIERDMVEIQRKVNGEGGIRRQWELLVEGLKGLGTVEREQRVPPSIANLLS